MGSSSRGGPTPLRVLCLGDSLTGGYPPSHPYGGRLAERLEAAFPTHQVDVDVDGVPGEMVTGGRFARRARALWRDAKYDWTIVLGGTNDLGWRHPAAEVLQELEKVWDVPLSKGGKVLALTVPETRQKSETLDEARKTVNDGIMACKKQNVHTYDLHGAVPYHSMPPQDRPKYWNMDGVHFTEAGYDLIGDKVADGLIKILHLEEAQATDISSIVSDARQRKMIEDLIFEEERGNPKLLSQGYIVVRKRDLD
ncbi:hypothetical protein KJ359_005711 [Pestalotiopsis sp. 9143b]|nr:hypothetical protein KJ359_005711 [Pestalotiopsis sp. 9143b]